MKFKLLFNVFEFKTQAMFIPGNNTNNKKKNKEIAKTPGKPLKFTKIRERQRTLSILYWCLVLIVLTFSVCAFIVDFRHVFAC